MLTWFKKFTNPTANPNNKLDNRAALGRVDQYGRLWVNVGSLASGAIDQLPAALTGSGNLKVSLEEQNVSPLSVQDNKWIPDGKGAGAENANCIFSGTPPTIVAAASGGKTRSLAFIHIYNNAASDAEIYVDDTAGTPNRILKKVTIEAKKGRVFRFARGEMATGAADLGFVLKTTAASNLSCDVTYYED